MTAQPPRPAVPTAETLFLVRVAAAAIREPHLPAGAEQWLIDALRQTCRSGTLTVEDLLEIAFDLACDTTVALHDAGAMWSR